MPTTADPRVLIIDADRNLAKAVADAFLRRGYETCITADGVEGLRKASTYNPDIIVMDTVLPGVDGFDVFRRLKTGERTRKIPVIVLTDRAEETDQIVGYVVGADDYVLKPCGPTLVVAKAAAVLRRTRAASRIPANAVSYAGILIDADGHRVTVDGRVVPLTIAEFRVLLALVRASGRAIRRDFLLDAMQSEDTDLRTVDAHISWLRYKLEAAGSSRDVIQTVRGIGYCLQQKVVACQA